MVRLPHPCLDCRHGLVLPASVTASRQSVFWCRQRMPFVPGRAECPRHDLASKNRESGREDRPSPPAPRTRRVPA